MHVRRVDPRERSVGVRGGCAPAHIANALVRVDTIRVRKRMTCVRVLWQQRACAGPIFATAWTSWCVQCEWCASCAEQGHGTLLRVRACKCARIAAEARLDSLLQRRALVGVWDDLAQRLHALGRQEPLVHQPERVLQSGEEETHKGRESETSLEVARSVGEGATTGRTRWD
eukprot:6206740-Pleurochrysis_carterae.AAC.4